MIFVTTGTQLAFDRLVLGVERWAKKNNIKEEIYAQIGESELNFHCLKTKSFLTPSEYENALSKTTILVGHAGTGTIITAHDYQLPLIIMPRKFALLEHRNDHQMATAKKFETTPGVYVAHSESELFELLDRRNSLDKCGEHMPSNREKLISFLKNEISN